MRDPHRASVRLILFSDRNEQQTRSEEGSLRDEIPQAGLGGSPTYPHVAKPFGESSQGAKRYLTGLSTWLLYLKTV